MPVHSQRPLEIRARSDKAPWGVLLLTEDAFAEEEFELVGDRAPALRVKVEMGGWVLLGPTEARDLAAALAAWADTVEA